VVHYLQSAAAVLVGVVPVGAPAVVTGHSVGVLIALSRSNQCGHVISWSVTTDVQPMCVQVSEGGIMHSVHHTLGGWPLRHVIHYVEVVHTAGLQCSEVVIVTAVVVVSAVVISSRLLLSSGLLHRFAVQCSAVQCKVVTAAAVVVAVLVLALAIVVVLADLQGSLLHWGGCYSSCSSSGSSSVRSSDDSR
jgi:hypothetical protein